MFFLRREGDSNPRYAFDVYTLSRRAPSTARPSLLYVPERIRTSDLRYRKPMLYPAKLRVHLNKKSEREGFEPSVPVLQVQLLSRKPHSATLASLLTVSRIGNTFELVKPKNYSKIGESGIRTHGRLITFNGFQDRRIRPLCHLSYQDLLL